VFGEYVNGCDEERDEYKEDFFDAGAVSVHCFEEVLECVELDGRVEGREGGRTH